MRRQLLIGELTLAFEAEMRVAELDGCDLVGSGASRVDTFGYDSFVRHLLVVHTEVVLRLSLGSISDLVAVLVGIHRLGSIRVRELLFVLSRAL